VVVRVKAPLQILRRRGADGHLGAAHRRRLPGGLDAIDYVLASAVGLAVLLVHDVPYLLQHSFWVDEAWVADSVRASIGLTHSLSSSTPLGWTFLLRLVPFGGPERLRLVPLAFAMLAAAAGYLFGRELRLTRFVTGILTGAAVLLSPAILLRNDLKQYTAEAFACVLVWLLVARIENEWRARRLVAIALTASAGMLFANTVIFVGAAAMASLALECLVKSQFRRLAAVAAASAGMLIVGGTIYLTLIRPQITHNLAAYWTPFYMPISTASAAVSFLHQALQHLAPYLGFRSLVIDAALVAAGIAALIWMRRIALAALFPYTLAIVIAASGAGKYPFGDIRTSTFWLVAAPLLMAVAVAAAGRLAAALSRRAPVALARCAPLAVAAAALGVWVPLTDTYIGTHEIPNEDVHSEVAYLDAHLRRGDVVIVSYAASYAFAYYYPRADPSFVADTEGPNAHVPAYPSVPWIIVMPDRQAADVSNALAAARAEIAAEAAGTRGRIWIIRSHLQPTEITAWQQDLARDRVSAIDVGADPILLYVPS
jgi:hypothetical protein